MPHFRCCPYASKLPRVLLTTDFTPVLFSHSESGPVQPSESLLFLGSRLLAMAASIFPPHNGGHTLPHDLVLGDSLFYL